MNEKKSPAAACPVRIGALSVQRNLGGLPIGLHAAGTEIREGASVLVIDPTYLAGCANDARHEAEKVLDDALQRFLQSGGKGRWDEAAGQLARHYRDIDIEKSLAVGYRAEARQLESDGGAPAEIIKWQDAAAASTAKIQQLQREAEILRRQLNQERDLLLKVVEGHLREALAAHQNHWFAEAHKRETEAVSAFLPAYAQAVRARLTGQGATHQLLAQMMESVVLNEPKRPDGERQEPQRKELLNALASIRD